MIPVRLTVTNFMPYRGEQPPLVLEGLGVACLSGENGSGKSSLLDALTWALWGRSRAGDEDDPLVSAGESEMAVEVELRVGEGRYRVLRRHRKPRGKSRSGQTTLELQSWDGTRFRPMSGTSVRETQRQIVDLLRLDYETFINTAFLLQGRADLFTVKTPAERKRLLGDILGLGYYDKLAERAREQARARELKHFAATQRLADLDMELSGEEGVRSELETRTQAVQTARALAGAAEAESRRLREQVDRLGQAVTERERLRLDAGTRSAEMGALRQRLEAASRRVAEGEAVASRQGEIEAGHTALEAARGAVRGYGERAGRFALLTERKAALERTVATARAALEREVASLEAQAKPLRDLGMQVQAISARRDLAEKARLELDVELETQSARTKRLEALAGEVQSRQARIQRLREDREDLNKRLGLLVDQPDGRCPLCGSEMGSHGLGRVREHYQERGREIQEETAALSREGTVLQEERRRLDTESQREAARLRQATAQADALVGRLRSEEERAAKAVRDLGEVELRLRQVRSRLEAEDYAGLERAALGDLALETAKLGYDRAEHEALQSRATSLERWEAERRRLDATLATLPQDRAVRTELAERIAKAESDLAELSSRLAALGDPSRELAATQSALLKARTEEAEARERLERETQEITRLQARLEEIGRRREERRRQAGEARAAAEERAIYDELAAAFSVRGVQALLIETALPELEEEANALLSRMTENRMHLSLRTQRETRAGGQQETLEVLIADEWGTRPYELYSGGEAFRVNFALRIGLSKLLARRAGAQVPLLFIDEGFGTQDAAGRERLVEAISTLQQDAAFRDGLVLVITHMDDIKEQFETRIEVRKSERGSTFAMVGA